MFIPLDAATQESRGWFGIGMRIFWPGFPRTVKQNSSAPAQPQVIITS